MVALRSVSVDGKHDYTINWSDWLDGSDTIATSDWTVEPTGPTITNKENTTTTATAQIEGCQENTVYRLVNTITTNAGRKDSRGITLRCSDR